jgi:putative ABC transport system substrate-binding protein
MRRREFIAGIGSAAAWPVATRAQQPTLMIITIFGASPTQRNLIIAIAARHRLPAVYPSSNFVTDGGLISYGLDQIALYRQAASYVSRIFKGEKPADLPVQAPTKFETVISLKTATALGLTIPEALLATADEVIQ